MQHERTRPWHAFALSTNQVQTTSLRKHCTQTLDVESLVDYDFYFIVSGQWAFLIIGKKKDSIDHSSHKCNLAYILIWSEYVKY